MLFDIDENLDEIKEVNLRTNNMHYSLKVTNNSDK